jgi:hypothetical protein
MLGAFPWRRHVWRGSSQFMDRQSREFGPRIVGIGLNPGRDNL